MKGFILKRMQLKKFVLKIILQVSEEWGIFYEYEILIMLDGLKSALITQ